ncbi:unnamed protein product (macronuclear) [Paramecium tetraurelia]|uniref:PAS domain-containing protein n=1 Tax=Paramecium tetraurelia TaxID=5888 RepID=A0E7G8_PARTE|nr:uncharacterized protein GSPATT00023963001 [Paramecium tetraurelia]CAK91235.1 unnamed protein product [Paramecium tetraurelia]|eukprot:XP_001458632.1 hypothetical protein (macronuclear) [Paramecium tetraurelia strain d4-2]
MSLKQEFTQTLWDQLKLSLFNVAYQIIGQNNQSFQTTCLLSFIQFIQLLYFPFQIQLQFAWHNVKLSGEIQKFLQYFTSIRMLNQQKTSVYLIAMYCGISIVLLIAIIVLLATILKQLLNNQFLMLVLSVTLKLIMTAGFVEILRLHLGFLVCKRDNRGELRMFYTTDQVCWQDSYIIHACIVIFSLAVLFFIVIIGSQLFIEVRNNQKNTFSQREGSTYTFMFVYVSLSMFSYSLIELPKYAVIVILIQLLTSFLFFYKIRFKKPFYNRSVQKIWSAISGLVFYTNFMLLTTFTFEHLVFIGTMKGWLVTMPMLLVILLQDERSTVNLLKSNMIQELSSQEIIQLSEFLIELCDCFEKDKNKEILVLGFLEVHKQTCLNPQCAIKTSIELAKKFKDNLKYTDKRMILKEIIDQIYQVGLQTYPLNVDLKLHYSYFLLDTLEQGQKALIEVDKADMCCPSFAQQFLIFKMRKIIDQNYQRSATTNQVKYIQTLDRSMKYQYKQIQQLAEECAYYKIQFWNTLLDENPNLSSIQKYGKLILESVHLLKKQLFKIQINTPLDSSIYRLIEKFSKYVHQLENYKGFQIANKQKVVSQQSEHQYLKNQDELSMYSYPVIVLELFGKPNQPTIIKNVNQAFHSLLGYSKTDVIGKPLSLILQSTYQKLHSVFVESYFSQLRPDQLNETGERSQFLVSKNKYILQTFSINSIYMSDKGIFQFCRLRQEKCYNNCAYIIFNLEGKIESISATCISILNLDIRQLQIRQLTIQRLFPYLMYNKEEYINKMNLVVFEHQTHSLSQSSDHEEKFNDSCISRLYYAQLYEISTKNYMFSQGDYRQQIYGYYLKVQMNEAATTKDDYCLIKRNIFKHQFKFSVEQNAYIFEHVSQSTSQYESNKNDSDVQDEPKVAIYTQQSIPSKKFLSMTNLKLQSGLGHDIKTLRLFQGEIKEIIDLDQDEEEEEQIRERTQKLQLEEDKEQPQQIKINNQEELMYHLLSVPYSPLLKKLILILNSLLILMFVIAIVMYKVIINTQNQFESAISYLAASNQRFASILKIQSNLQDLRGCYLNLEQYTMKTTGGRYVQINYAELNNELKILLEIDQILTSANVNINEKYQKVLDDFQSASVQMFTKNNNFQNFTFTQAIEQMISKAITLNNSNISAYVDDNEDFHYYLHNTLNSIPKYQLVSQAYYYYNILSLIDDLEIEEESFFTIQICCLSFIFLFFQLYVFFHQKIVKEIISLYLEIRDNYIRKMINQFQIFIQLLQLNENDEIESIEEDAEVQEEQDYNLGFSSKNKKRKSTFEMNNYRKVQVNFLFFLTLIISYFSYIYFSSTTITDQTKSLVPLVNLTSFMPTQYRLIDNSIKEMLYDENAILFNEFNSQEKLEKELEEVRLLDAELHALNQKNELILSDRYKQVFNEIYILNPCDIILANDPSVNSTACLNFNQNILQEGLSIAITNFFENAQNMLQQYQYYNKNAVYNNLTFNISSDHRQNYTCNIYNTRGGNANRKMQKVFIRVCHMQLLEELQSYLYSHYSDLQLQFTLLFMIFCVISVLVYFVIWIPLQARFYSESKTAREIQSLIPVDLFNNCQSLQAYLRQIKEKR